MSDYRNAGQLDEPRQRIPEGFWPDYLLSMAIVWQGVNNRLPPEKLPNGFVPDSQNSRMRNGDIEPRKGVVKPGWLNNCAGQRVLPAGEMLYGAGVFSDPASREWTMIAADGYIWACCPGNQRQAVAVPSGVSAQVPVSFCQAFNQLYMFRGRYLRPLVLKAIGTGFVDIEPLYNASTGGSLGNGSYQGAVQPIGQLADEMAYGPYLAVTSMTLVGTTMTVVTTQPHGYVDGTDVTFQGVTPAAYNSRWMVSVVDNYTFTFQVPAGVIFTLPAAAGSWTALNGPPVTSIEILTQTPHGMTTGQSVLISGAAVASVNGTYTVTVIDTTHFSITLSPGITTANVTALNAAAATLTVLYGAPSGGSIKVSNNQQFWQALGDRLTIGAGNLTSYTTVGTVAYTAHGLSVGQWVTITGASPAAYNGVFQVQTVPDANHFTFTLAAGAPTSPATGTIYVYRPTVTPGDTPDSNPEAWNQIFNVLPNADDALYVNGRMLVPTAYTPGETTYDSTSTWTKKDYLVAMDVFDGVHFQFTNAFRINQGDDSEISNLVKYDNNTVIVIKGKRWGILSNLQSADYNQITFDLHAGEYGSTALRAAVAAGKDVYFASPLRGMTGLNQTQQGLVQGVDVPVSHDVPQWLSTINWNAAGLQRVTWWNDCIYWAVAVNSSAVNNAIFVYDLELHQWVSRDVGLNVVEFFQTTIGGLQRLCFLGGDGWVNVMEEATAGDMVGDTTQPGGVGWVEIPTDTTIKGHLFGQPGQKSYPLVELGVAVWNATMTVTVTTGGARSVRATTVAAKTFSRTSYFKPFDAAPWNPLNVNNDYGNPNRGDYSVVLEDGLNLTGCSTLQWQELFLRPSTKNFRASYALIRIQNATGRLKIKAVTPAAQPGERRFGVMI
jgi:hypothetical protein